MESRDGALPGQEVVTARARCMQSGCAAQGAARCGYEDSRGLRCASWWCSDHTLFLKGRPFCRRHQELAAVLESLAFAPPAPAVDSRAASLVAFLQRRLHQPVEDMLLRLASPASAAVISEPLQLLATPARRERRWRSAWKLADQSGARLSLTVEVDERREDEVIARVDSRIVGHGVPPWIERRRRGQPATPEREETERRAFIAGIAQSLDAVASGDEVVPGFG